MDSICRAQPDFRHDFERLLPSLFPFLREANADDQDKIKKLVDLWISTNIINTPEIRNEFEKHFGYVVDLIRIPNRTHFVAHHNPITLCSKVIPPQMQVPPWAWQI
jgi:hypothetical protein